MALESGQDLKVVCMEGVSPDDSGEEFSMSILRLFSRPRMAQRIPATFQSRSMNRASSASAEEPYLWGRQFLSFGRAREHFLVLGSTGSGKTALLKRLMATVLPRVGAPGFRCRAMVYDAKKDMYSVLRSMGISEDKIVVVNPFDARSAAWDIAADVRTQPEATELANLLIPKESESQPFFANTARAVLRGVIEVLIAKTPGRWTLRHVLLACEDEIALRGLLASHVSTKGTLSLMKKEETWRDIKATLDSHLHRYRFIAAAWEAAKTKFSIKEWLMQREFVILLGNDDNARTEIDTINRLFFSKMAQLINDQSEGFSGQETWIFLDEVREAGKLDNLRSLLLRARSKNCAVVLGFQDVLGMEAVYGREEARELLGCPANVAILHLNHNAFDARKWAADVFGEAEVEEVSENVSASRKAFRLFPAQTSAGTNVNVKRKFLFMPFEFYDLERAGSPGGMQGVFIANNKFGKITIANQELFGNKRGSTDEAVPPRIRNFIARSTEDFYLEPWGSRDALHLAEIASIFETEEADLLARIGPAENLDLPRLRPPGKFLK